MDIEREYLEQQQVIERLKGEVESLKCCGNCMDYNRKVKDFCNLTCTGIYDPMSAKCKDWQPLPKAPEVSI